MNTSMQQSDYSWRTPCILDLDYGAMDYRADTERWVFCLIDEQDIEIYRDDITDREILSGKKLDLRINIKELKGDKPVKYLLWPRLQDGTFTERRIFPIPTTFLDKYGNLLQWAISQTIPDKTVTCEVFGGLANQLFQIMTTVAFARQHAYTPIIYDDMYKSPSMMEPRDTYWDSVFSEVLKLGRGFKCDAKAQVLHIDPEFTYTPVPTGHRHLKLWGYFSSYKYLDFEREYILSQIESCKGIMDEADKAFSEIKKQIPAGKLLVSVHVRRGDYLLQNNTFQSLPLNYYQQSMKHFKDVHFLVFSDDIAWCKDHFDHPYMFFVESQKDYVDMLLMSKCDHHIIANSTFSWWGAYLNRSTKKQVIYPYPWFIGEKASRDLSDFLYPEWIPYPA